MEFAVRILRDVVESAIKAIGMHFRRGTALTFKGEPLSKKQHSVRNLAIHHRS